MPTGIYVRKPISDETRRKMGEARRKWKFSEESKEKMRQSHIGKSGGGWHWKMSEERKLERRLSKAKDIPIRRRHPLTEETKAKIRKAVSGEKNHSWKGGIKTENELIRTSALYYEWRKKVFDKDGFICQKCKERKDGVLRAHHIQNFSQYPDLRMEVGNGITFCKDCHTLFHKKYGLQNNNAEQIKEFLTTLKN